jgi:hypothetical protein
MHNATSQSKYTAGYHDTQHNDVQRYGTQHNN